MDTPDDSVSVPELQRLLYTIADNRLNTCFRYRLLGEMWQPNFLRVVHVSENGVLLNDEIVNTYKCLQDLSQIVQFEIDVALHQFLPHYHYNIGLGEKPASGIGPDLISEHA